MLPVPPFYSHPVRDENGAMAGGKLLTAHNAGVDRISQAQFFDGVRFSVPAATLREFLSGVVAYHDLLKYLTFFQRYLRGDATVERDLKNHAAGGALVYFLHHRERAAFTFQDFLGYFLIRGHHRDLWYPANLNADPLISPAEEKQRRKILRRQMNDLRANAELIRGETGIEVPAEEHLVLGRPLRRHAK